jgi:hypothetical protein
MVTISYTPATRYTPPQLFPIVLPGLRGRPISEA